MSSNTTNANGNNNLSLCHASIEACVVIDHLSPPEAGARANMRNLRFKVLFDASPEPDVFSLNLWSRNPPVEGEAVRIKATIVHDGRAATMPQLTVMRLEQFPWADMSDDLYTDMVPSFMPITVNLAGIVRALPDGVMPPATPDIKQFMVFGEIYQDTQYRPFYFIVEIPATPRWRRTNVPSIGTNVHLIGSLVRREAMGTFVVEVMHLDLPRRGVNSAPSTPVSVARDRVSQRLRQRRDQQPSVHIIEDPDEEVPAASQGSAGHSPAIVSGSSRVQPTPNAVAGPSQSSPQMGGISSSPVTVAGPSTPASSSTPLSSTRGFQEPETPTPEAGPRRNGKRKSTEAHH